MYSIRSVYVILLIFVIYFLFFGSTKNFNQKNFRKEKTRVLIVKIIVDNSFTSRPNWKDHLKLLVANASYEFNKQFKIKFKIKKIKLVLDSAFPLKTFSDLPSYDKSHFTPILFALERIMHLNVKAKLDWVLQNNDFKDYDIVLFFSGEDYKPCLGMVDSISGRVALISNPQRGLDRKRAKALIIHEIGHLFGAVHVEDEDSVMCNSLVRSVKFDYKNQIIIFKNKWRDFSKNTKRR